MPSIKRETDREPDFIMKIWFTPYGYEAKAYDADGLVFSRGRDTGETTPPIKRMVKKLQNETWNLLERLYIGLDEG